MPELELSVVIPNRDGRELLAACLPPLLDDLAALTAAEVIVVDDHSRDGSAASITAQFPDVRVLELGGAPEGFAAACNAGARLARGAVIAFLNSDTEVRSGWAGGLLAALEADPEAVIAGGLALYADAPETVNTAGVMVGPSGSGADIGLGAAVAAVDLTPREVAAVSGVSMAVRAGWFSATGGFDEQLFMYFEDVELCLRAWREGHGVRFTPDSVVLHRGGATAGSRHDRLRSHYGSRNRILVAALCQDREQLPLTLATLLLQDLATVVALLAGARPRTAWVAARARAAGAVDGILRLRSARRARLARHRYVRSFGDLRERGLIAGWRESVQEFVRVQRLR